jgi:pimeloyl-ACP methyl ester carboxylesterase
MRRILIFLAALGAAGCAVLGDSREPIATETLRATRPSGEGLLVIVLPGYGDDGRGRRERAMARMIQEEWPHADVMLAAATFDYYRDGKLVERLHHDVVAPARRAGYRRIWLTGPSLGGLGSLLYERAHPGTLAGVVLFAPFLGDEGLLEEIRGAGGVAKWDPGALGEINGHNFQRHVWSMVKGWAERPQSAPRVWLACGSDDEFLGAAKLLATVLPEGRFVEMPGGHRWSSWTRIGKEVFSRIAAGPQPP